MNSLVKKKASTFMVILAFATVYIVWGSTYFFIQKAIVGFPTFLLGAIRFLIAGALMLAWALFRGERVFVKKEMIHASVSGVLMLFVGTGAVIWVEQYLPSAMVAIIVSGAPLWFVLLDKPNWAHNFKNKLTIGGLFIGFAGIFLLFSEKIFGSAASGNSHELVAVGVLILGSISWTIGSLYSKHHSSGGSVSVNIAWQMLAAGVAFIPGVFLRSELQHFQWNTIPAAAWFSVWYLILFGSIAAFSAYVWLLQVRPATQVSTYAYVNPVVAVLLGVFFAHEHISLFQVLGLLTILVSVLMINLVKYRNQQKDINKDAAPKPEAVQEPVKSLKTKIAAPINATE